MAKNLSAGAPTAKGGAPPPPPPPAAGIPPPPPVGMPPPIAPKPSANKGPSEDGISALMAAINRGGEVTKGES